MQSQTALDLNRDKIDAMDEARCKRQPRLVEQGEATERFHGVASRMVLAAMVPLALGLTGDCVVVVRKATGALTWGLISASLLLVVCYGLWFGVTPYCPSPRPKR